jgi:hypothetical protein
MPAYDLEQEIVERSLEELIFIINWVNEHENNLDNPITILIGGWAVDAYNPWYGSIDIDLVTNSRTKESLKYLLRQEREFQPYKSQIENTVVKYIENNQEIRIDFANREVHDNFEGREEELNFDILDGKTTTRLIRDRITATIPERTLLLLYKIKAAWDRNFRVEHNTSYDLEYDKSKYVKDIGDILALLDPEKGGHEIDLNFLGKKIEQYGFLKEIISIIPKNFEAIGKYSHMNNEQVEKTISDLLSLIEKRKLY